MNQINNVRVFQDEAELAEATAKYIIELANHTVDGSGRFVISLSGGHTPEQLFTLMSKTPFRDQMPWHKTFVFWGDERCVPATDKQNNGHMAKSLLLDHVGLPAENIYAIPVELSPEETAKKYEQTIKNFFGDDPTRFDLILLGLGENGHTASLFPDTDVLTDHTDLVKEVFVAEQKMFRITMTAKLINKARNIVFLVAGDGKAEILRTVLKAPYQPDKYPAQLIKPVEGNLYWYVDNKAANLLNQ